MRDLLSRFSERLRETRSQRTSHTYSAIAAFFAACAGSTEPDRRTVEDFLARARTTGTPPRASTRNQELAALRALSKLAVRDGFWSSDPTAGIPFAREPRRDPAVLTSGELRRLFEAASLLPGTGRSATLAMLALLSQGGLRVHELVALDVRQVDVPSATLVGVAGKGGTVVDVPLNSETLALLAGWLEERATVAREQESALFVSSWGSRISIRSVQRRIENLRSAVGTAKRVTPHTFRHTAATLALTLGCDLATVGDVLRHADLNTTRRYVHLVDERRREAVRRLGGLIPRGVLPAKSAEDPPNAPEQRGLDAQYPLDDTRGSIGRERPPPATGSRERNMSVNSKRAQKGARSHTRNVLAANVLVVIALSGGACGGDDGSSAGAGGAAGIGGGSGSGGSSGGADSGTGGGPGGAGGCKSSQECDDGKSCTIDTCNAGKCTSTIGPAFGSTACPTGQFCTVKDGCVQAPACATDQDCIDAWKGDACKTNPRCEPSSSVCVFDVLDKDHDGDPPQVCGGGDCDDADAERHTGKDELCDGKDNDCNGVVDEGSLCGSVSKCVSGTCLCNPENQCSTACADFQSDESHCGSCDAACKPGETCVKGACTCPAPKALCGAECVDLTNDPKHCGKCANTCNAATSTCKSGQCVCSAGGALTYCAGACVDVKTDGKNCGGCGKACASESCTNGVCDVCPQGKTLCSGVCVSLESDKSNCGTCGKVCPGPCPSCSQWTCDNSGCAGAGGI